ncbi:MAG: YggS family pyridoxal phosphate enzyme [Actinomycetota bacterium]
MNLPTVERVRLARSAVDGRIAAATDRSVDVVAVTKGFAPEIVEVAVEAGCRRIGENYAQELLTRVPVLDRLGERRPEVVFIGHLQSNKVRQLAGVVDVWGTVDRSSIAREIARRAPGDRVLLQLDVTGEAQKHGVPVDDADRLLDECRQLGLRPIGVLAMGPTAGGPDAARPGFERAVRFADDHRLEVRSLGMSADLEVAIAAGSTEVRVGTDLFGPRPPR